MILQTKRDRRRVVFRTAVVACDDQHRAIHQALILQDYRQVLDRTAFPTVFSLELSHT
jgi:hypothetical protein